jgi:putative Holliday junction resolvase
MGCILALDVGTKTIGVARADIVAKLASPHSTIARKGVKKDTVRLLHLIQELGVESIVVGLPYELDGTEGRSARLARQIGEALREASELPVHYQDERYSTVEAEHRLKQAGLDGRQRKSVIDQAAAAVILEDFLRLERPD